MIYGTRNSLKNIIISLHERSVQTHISMLGRLLKIEYSNCMSSIYVNIWKDIPGIVWDNKILSSLYVFGNQRYNIFILSN